MIPLSVPRRSRIAGCREGLSDDPLLQGTQVAITTDVIGTEDMLDPSFKFRLRDHHQVVTMHPWRAGANAPPPVPGSAADRTVADSA